LRSLVALTLCLSACAHSEPGCEDVVVYRCSLVLGVTVTSEWFGAGFEQGVGDARWEAITRPHTSLKEWSDPTNAVWSQPPVSPCASGANDPDRVLFTGMQWEYKTAAEWAAALSDVVVAIKGRYPAVKDIELLTMIRAPGNLSCGNDMSVVPPFVDEAMATVSARFPGLVHAAPRFEAPSCDAFKKGGPHFTPEGAAAMAKVLAAHYAHTDRVSRCARGP
jgi:hypothetical protein